MQTGLAKGKDFFTSGSSSGPGAGGAQRLGKARASSLAGVAAPPSQFRIPYQARSARQVPSSLPRPATAADGDRPSNYDRRCVGRPFARHVPGTLLANTLEPPACRSQHTAYGKQSDGSGNADKAMSSASLDLLARRSLYPTLEPQHGNPVWLMGSNVPRQG